MTDRTDGSDGTYRTRPDVAGELERVFREEHGRVVATLVRQLGDIDLAEEAAQEAFVAAAAHWPRTGLPPNPGGWLTTTARNRAIDRLRRESTRDARQKEAVDTVLAPPEWEPEPATSVGDDRLRLLFTCCHPALAPAARIALSLRLLGGLTTAEIAAAFLVPEATMAQRLTRAKRKIAAARIPYRVPSDAELPDRLRDVLATVYLVGSEGYLASSPGEPLRPDLTAEAIRLARLLVRLLPDEPEARGLLALLLLTEARRPARVADGAFVPLPEQDRSRWDTALVAEGHELVRACLRRGAPGPYQLVAAVQAVHTDAPSAADTDWSQIRALYDQLVVLQPTPVVALNRAVAVAETDGAAAALELVDALDLERYHPWHVTRAELLVRLRRRPEAAQALRRALDLTTNPAERAHLGRRLATVTDVGAPPP